MQDGVHSSTTGASARSWWTPTPASWYSFCGPPECNGGPAGGVSCWKILDIYNRVALATLMGLFLPSHAWLLRKQEPEPVLWALIKVIQRHFFRIQVHVFEQPLHLLAGECALCQIMYSLAGLFWRNDLGCASVIPSEQTASSYIILYRVDPQVLQAQLCYKYPRFSSKKRLRQGLHCTQEVRKSWLV